MTQQQIQYLQRLIALQAGYLRRIGYVTAAQKSIRSRKCNADRPGIQLNKLTRKHCVCQLNVVNGLLSGQPDSLTEDIVSDLELQYKQLPFEVQ
jgi:hypothetical protein